MAEKITTKKFASNVIVSITAQIISMAVSFVITLIVPKFIPKSEYSLWQTYALYAGYVGILHFGLLDGIVLRYSKYDYNELEKERLRSQFLIMLCFTSAFALIAATVANFAVSGDNGTVVLLVGVAIITHNVSTYGTFLLQITNRINKYASVVIAQRITMGLAVIVLLFLRVDSFEYYCAADILGALVSVICGLVMNRGLYFGIPIRAREAFRELGTNVSAGIILTLANWSAGLIVGGAKMVVQWRWDYLMFADVSFAFSMANIFLSFVSAISVVAFPSLQRLEPDKLPSLYGKVRRGMSLLLFSAMSLYFAGCWVLERWLPQYTASLVYLGILLPIIIYSSRVNLLTNNYLKVYRKEKQMMVVNLVSIALGAAAFALAAYVFDNLTALLCCVIGTIMLQSLLSEICVLRVIKKRIVWDFAIEAAMTAGFILCASMLGRLAGFLTYLGMLAVYAAFNCKSIAALINRLKNLGRTKR